jgi:hypothetical protein
MWCNRCHLDHGPTVCDNTAPPAFIVDPAAGTVQPTLNPLSPFAITMLDPISGGLRPQFQHTRIGELHLRNGGKLAPRQLAEPPGSDMRLLRS